MAWTTIAYSESIDEAGIYSALAAVPDQHIRVDDDKVYIGDMNQIIAVFAALGTSAVAAYLSAPSLRRLALYDVLGIQNALVPTAFYPYADSVENPVALERNEALEFYSLANPAAAERHTSVVFLGDGAPSPVTGEIFPVRASASITCVAGQWTNGELSFNQTLPVGRYQIVGCNCVATNAVSFRFVPIGYSYRPGGICSPSVGTKSNDPQRAGRLGVWCEFDQLTPPSVDILAADTCTSQDFVVDLIKVA